MDNKANELRKLAAEKRARSRESFERCDTDGFLSQWASDISAQELEAKADILERGGVAWFPGLYDGERRVAAKIIHGRYGKVWMLREDEQQRYGRKFIPVLKRMRPRVQRELGLTEVAELAPADAKIDVPQGRNNRGLAGCANAQVVVYRCGDPWGLDVKRG